MLISLIRWGFTASVTDALNTVVEAERSISSSLIQTVRLLRYCATKP